MVVQPNLVETSLAKFHSFETGTLASIAVKDTSFCSWSSPVTWAGIYKSPATDINQQLSTSMLDLLARENMSISECYKAYLSIVAPRFPIISQTEFLYRISNIHISQDAYLSLLIVCMALIVRSSLKPDEPNPPGTIYYTAKSFFTILSSSRKLSLELVQAGCLIAHYEYCQALLEAASSTIWTCAKMGYALELDKMLSPTFSFDSLNRITIETGRCIWWSIFMLERYYIPSYMVRSF